MWVVFIMLGPFFSHQVPLDLEYDSDEAVESQNEDDLPSMSANDASEGLSISKISQLSRSYLSCL